MIGAKRSAALLLVAVVVPLLVGAGGCGPQPAAARGQALFNDPGFAKAQSNVFSCGTCHSVLAGGDADRILSGYTLHDVTARTTYWGGNYTDLLDAVNECYVEFMRGQPLTATDVDGRALLVYLESISPDPSSPSLPLTVIENIDSPIIPDGDATRGATIYAQACANCHGTKDTGDGRLGPLVSIIPTDSITQHGTCLGTGARDITIEKIEHGKFFNVGGNMPLYSEEAFSLAQTGDVLAYLGLTIENSPVCH